MSQNIFSLEGLISWLEVQPPVCEYVYMNTGGCLVVRYLRARGLPIKSTGSSHWTDDDARNHPLLTELDMVADERPYTYGAALERARSMLAKQKES